MVNLRGLHSHPNQFLAPNGAARAATNCIIERPGIIGKRRGFSRWSATLTFAIDALLPYRGVLLAHCGSRLSSVATNGVATVISTDAVAAVSPTGLGGGRLRGCTGGQNFYCASDSGVRRLSKVTGTLDAAGGLVAPGFDNMGVATPLTDAGGFLGDGYSVAYRYVLVRFDNFSREIVGPVSGRLVVANVTGVVGYSAGNAMNYTVRALLPPEATQHDVIRIYRSAQKLSGQALDDDMKLVYEVQLKQLDITNGYFQQKDITPDLLRGGFIYTAPNAGEGLARNNEQPPFCTDIAFHKSRLWFAGTKRRTEFDLQILAVGGTAGIQNNDRLYLNGTGGLLLTAKTAAPGVNEYLVVTSGTASYNIEQTALNLVSAINKHSTNTILWARYISGPDDVPGKILITARSPAVTSYSITVGAGSKRDCFNPSLLADEHIVNLTRTAGTVRATVTSGTQSYKVGEQVVIGPGGAGSAGSVFGTGPFTISAIDAANAWFEYLEAGLNGTLNAQSATLFAIDTLFFQQEDKPNRIYYSKFAEPDAVPRDNWIDVGAEDKEIVAIVAQGTTLQVWKQDGIYRVVGDDEVSFDPREVDVNMKAIVRDMVKPFQGQVAGLTQKGIVIVSETGVIEDLDFPIRKDTLSQITTQDANGDLTKCFMVAYEAEDQLLVFWSGNKDLDSGVNSSCNFGYVYNGQADEWTRWEWDAADSPGNGKTCGVMNPDDQRLYFGDTYKQSTSETYIYKERKSRIFTDFKDTRGDGTENAISWEYQPVVQTARAPGLDKQWNEVGLMFNGVQPLSVAVDDANEFANGGTHTVAALGQWGNRIWPYATNGRLLNLSIRHTTIEEGIELAGLLLDYEVLGLAVQK